MDRRTSSSPIIVPTQEEAAKLGLPKDMVRDLDTSAAETIIARLMGAIKKRRELPVIQTNVKAFVPRSQSLPGQGRRKIRLQDRRPSQRPSRGRATWLATAKAKHKAERQKG